MSEGKKPSGWAMNKRSKRAKLTQDYVIECLKWEAEGQGVLPCWLDKHLKLA